MRVRPARQPRGRALLRVRRLDDRVLEAAQALAHVEVLRLQVLQALQRVAEAGLEVRRAARGLRLAPQLGLDPDARGVEEVLRPTRRAARLAGDRRHR